MYKALDKATGEIVALKRLMYEGEDDEIFQEISIMKECKSPYIVKYYGHYLKDDEYIYVSLITLEKIRHVLKKKKKNSDCNGIL